MVPETWGCELVYGFYTRISLNSSASLLEMFGRRTQSTEQPDAPRCKHIPGYSSSHANHKQAT